MDKIKTWEERHKPGVNFTWTPTPITNAMQAEITELRKALAARATPAQPVQPCIAASEKHPLFYRKLADLQQRGYEIFGHILHKNGEYALFDDSCRWLTQPQYWRLMHEQDGSLFATPSTE